MKRKLAIVIGVALVAALLIGCGQSANLEQQIKQKDAQITALQAETAALKAEIERLKAEVARLSAPQGSTVPLPGNQNITLYFIKSTPTEFYLAREDRLIKSATGTQLIEAALKELISGPKTQGLLAVLPKDTRVLSVKLDKDLATVNFSKEIQKLGTGARGEALAVSAIANTLTDLGNVTRVQILVEGKIVESLAGHVDIRNPVRRDLTVIVK